ncbi:MAG: LuxR C-terminal-related transcriptional regulator, partial [Oscillospiraceae bacterium]
KHLPVPHCIKGTEGAKLFGKLNELITDTDIFIEKEKYQELDDEVSSHLSEREWQIFRLFLRGSTYDQMARQLNVSRKTVDNALQRVRRKLKSVWRADHF